MSVLIDIVTSGTRGLRRDADITHAILSRSYRTKINISRVRNAHLFHRRWAKALVNRLLDRTRIVLFFEILPDAWMRLAMTRVFIPNQEWLRDDVVKNLSACTDIWCKTHYAETVLRRLGFEARYIGFSSVDMYDPAIIKDYGKFIHVAGRSHLKGTRTILDLWRAHPEWPALLVITSNGTWASYAARNIQIRPNNLSDDELRGVMNHYGIHLCPSETEGFGHYISEALSTKALVISVDAPPMNELVAPGSGLLARYNRVERMSFSERFFVDAADLERQIEASLEMSQNEKAAIGDRARGVYLRRDAAFGESLCAAVDTVVKLSTEGGSRNKAFT